MLFVFDGYCSSTGDFFDFMVEKIFSSFRRATGTPELPLSAGCVWHKNNDDDQNAEASP